MAIAAIALLRIDDFSLPPGSALRIDSLDDAILLHTGASFGSEPEALTESVRTLLGDALAARHKDPRGIFFLPDVARPRGRTYDAVLEEIGEAGVWGPCSDDEGDLEDLAGDGGLGALLGGLLQQLPSPVLAAASAAAQGDTSALEDVSAQLHTLLRDNSQLASLAEQLSSMLGQPGLAAPAPSPGQRPDLSALLGAGGMQELAGLLGETPGQAPPEVEQLAARLSGSLGKDEAELARLAEQLFGGGAGQDEPKKKG